MADPDRWYVYGEYVLDRIIGKPRAESVNIFTRGFTTTPREIRETLNVPHSMTTSITTSEPKIICNLDQLIVKPDGTTYDLGSENEYVQDVLDIRLLSYNLEAHDILRLNRLRLDYPEIKFQTYVAEHIEQSVRYLLRAKKDFPELETLLLSFAPYTAWRTPWI